MMKKIFLGSLIALFIVLGANTFCFAQSNNTENSIIKKEKEQSNDWENKYIKAPNVEAAKDSIAKYEADGWTFHSLSFSEDPKDPSCIVTMKKWQSNNKSKPIAFYVKEGDGMLEEEVILS